MPSSSPSLVRTLKDHRTPLAVHLLPSLAGWSKFPEADSADPAVRSAFVATDLVVFIDYLTLYFERNDETFRDLYVGEKLKQCYDSADTPDQAIERRRRILASDRDALTGYLAPLLAPEALVEVTTFLDQVDLVVTGVAKRQVRVLFIGDCLHLDVLSFLAAPLLEQGFRLETCFATSKNSPELQRQLRTLAGQTFDLIFFSPFTYEFHPDYKQLGFLRTAALSADGIRTIVEQAQADTMAALRLLGSLFDAPVFVHNSSGIRRHDGTWLEQLKNNLTKRTRAIARRQINSWLPGALAALNRETYPHFFLQDEAALLQQHPEDHLSRMLYRVDQQHPAEFGRVISRLYLDVILAAMLLSKKKVVVCDLDNTLWKGVIGEGAVVHYRDRQQILKRLREKGLLLAINSKNDPRNVHFDGALLQFEDFVSCQINWTPKLQNMRRIGQELNLKTKDFLFLDDRADERAMVTESMPEVLALDAESPLVWRRLALAADLLPEQDDMDRTLAYKQRSERQQFLEDPAAAAAEQRELFRRLEFRVFVRTADRKELKRVTELINRTNQFNMCNTRTTLAEVTSWYESPRHTIFVVEARDRFGSMGTVSVAVVREQSDSFDLESFVLSCRVFGYGVETALLNHLKRMAASSDREKQVIGRYVETPYNQPCRDTFADNGFAEQDGVWIYAAGEEAILDPEWLTVETEYSAVA